jgi:nucleotide-binding universal stress UspA family protein
MTTVKAESLKKSSVSIHKILVAVDLTEHSKLTVSYATEIAKCLNASIVLVHVFEPGALFDYPNENSYQLVENQRLDYEMRLADLTEVLRGMQVPSESAFLVGDPAEKVGELAGEMGVDLIITASHHPKFLARLFNLDKAPQIMHRAPCPVLVYHEKNVQ